MSPEVKPGEVFLRPATPADASAVAPLIYAAGPLLFNRIYGPRPTDALHFFEAAFAQPGTPFSHENATVAEHGGEVVGLASSLPGSALRLAWPTVGRLMLRLRGPLFLLRLLPTVLDLRGSSEATPPEAYYLGILSVRADRRGRGIGALLLADVCRRAAAAGCGTVCLHVELNNDGAQRFYARHGFVVTAEHPTPRAARWGVSGFAAMRKEIGGPGSGYTMPTIK
jgi:ribosomal protein S18 acetylase RimI-like enzyme